MAIQIQGNGGTVSEVDGTTFRALRVTARPMDYGTLGFYAVNGRTSTYSGLVAGAPLFSMRWGDATRFAAVLKLQTQVVTTVAATTAGAIERELIIARSFTIADTGGVAVTLTGNAQKMRTSMGTSLVSDMRFGAPLTAGTRTLDANPIASVLGWAHLNHTGIVVGNGQSAAATAAAWGSTGGQYASLWDAYDVMMHPIVLAANEGIVVRIGKDAQATGSTQQTYLNLYWAELAAY